MFLEPFWVAQKVLGHHQNQLDQGRQQGSCQIQSPTLGKHNLQTPRIGLKQQGVSSPVFAADKTCDDKLVVEDY